jgi:hypothetical protein
LLNVVLPRLVWIEVVLHDVAADRLNSHIQVLGRPVCQAETMSHLPHEVDRGRQELGIGRNPDAGGGYFQVRCSMLICHAVCFSTDSSSAQEVRDSSISILEIVHLE